LLNLQTNPVGSSLFLSPTIPAGINCLRY
jgi:hypothetical protein